MKRDKFLRHLRTHGCELARNGAKHDIWQHAGHSKQTAVPRHAEIDDWTCGAICKQLEIPKPR